MSRPPPSPAVIALALRLYAEEASYREIGAKTGYAEGSVGGLIDRCAPGQLPRRPGPKKGGRHPPHLTRLTDARRDEYRTLRRGKGFTVAEALAAVSP